MTGVERQVQARLTVAEPIESQGRWSSISSAISDGTTQIAVGSALAATFGGEATKCFVTGEAGGRWWFLALAIAGLVAVFLGVWQRGRAGRRTPVGIVATATDPYGGRSRILQLEQRAEKFSRTSCQLTLKTNVDLDADGARNRGLVDEFVEVNLDASVMAERVAPDATTTNLFPAMAENVGFLFGAKIAPYPFAREVVVHEIGSGGSSACVPLLPPRTVGTALTPQVGRLKRIDEGEPTRVAIALDLRGVGDQYFDQVVATCKRDRIGLLLMITPPPSLLNEGGAAYTRVVDLVCREWQWASLSESERTGQHAIFLSGSLSVAVALGARLASRDHGRWTAYALDPASNDYEPFPPPHDGNLSR